VILHRKNLQLTVAKTFVGAVVQIHVSDFEHPLVERRRVHRKPMVLRGDLDFARQKILDWMVCSMMSEFQLEGSPAQGERKKLVAQTDPEHGLLADEPPDILNRISDRGGITNIYRLNVASGAQTQVTNLVTGVSGITSLSPALSIARETGRLVYSIYQEGNYAVYSADSAAVLAGAPLADTVTPDPALLPPQNRQLGELERLRADYSIGEDAAATQTVSSYHPRLALDYVAQPYLAVGASSYGTFIGGGVTLYWSDMLGDQNLATMLQVSGSLSNLAALVAYQNTRNRLNWGVAVQQIPYVTGGYLPTSTDQFGNFIQQVEIIRQTDREADAFFAYPFSSVSRVEWSAGARNISYAVQIESLVVNPAGMTFLTGGELDGWLAAQGGALAASQSHVEATAVDREKAIQAACGVLLDRYGVGFRELIMREQFPQRANDSMASLLYRERRDGLAAACGIAV
jgi:hypothetical protein